MTKDSANDRTGHEPWPELLTTREVAQLLRLREKTLYAWSDDTRAPLRPVRIRSGSRHLVRWRRADVLALLEQG